MNYETLLHIICLSGTVLCAVTLILYLIFKKCSILQKINASIYLIALGAYLLFTEKLVSFVQTYYYSVLSYNLIMTSIITATALIGVILVLIGLFNKTEKFQTYAYKGFEVLMLILSIALIWSIFTSVTKSLFLVPIIFLTLIFSEYFMVNATETLENKTSKIIYFTVNAIIGVLWLIGMILLAVKISFNTNTVFVILSIIALILALSSILLGILRIKKERNND